MSYLVLFLIAIGLSFDTFAVSVAAGITLSQIRFWQAVKFSIVLGLFQGIMPFFGWLIGQSIHQYINNLDHWIAFGLLGFLGVKMVIDSYSAEESKAILHPLQWKVMIALAIATSIDALVVGVGFGMISSHLYLAPFIIGGITFLVAMLGILFGKKMSHTWGKQMERLGGAILFLLGVKILVEHML